MTTPAALCATPSRGQHQRPGKAGSAVLLDLGHFAPAAALALIGNTKEFPWER